MLELLAPAGDLKSFYSAINSGADAVYLGLANFNARMKAENFNSSNIRDIVRYAHFYGAKVYVTLNTIIIDSEFEQMLKMVEEAYLAKVDAFIVQDIGICSVLIKKFPNIVLHASTQMGIHNLYGAKVAEKFGIKRVVLSRETKLEDIRLIRQNTNLEIEYFIQGALCIAFSGNCYLSSYEQRASGNRGECKQLCRLPYETIVDGKKKTEYLLSARDLSLKDNLKDLIDAGVTSFKIEGRMRREGYVAQAVSVYRSILDDINSNVKHDGNSDNESLKLAFNRGDYLSRAYLDEKIINAVEPRYNNHIGINIGKVINVKPFKEELYEVTITSKHKLVKGDGIKFFSFGKEIASIGIGDPQQVGEGKYKFVTKTKCEKDWDVSLTLDFAKEDVLLNKNRLLSIDCEIIGKIGMPLKMIARYNNIVVNMDGDIVEEAKNAPVSKDDILTQISKVQDEGFVVNNAKIDIDNIFVPKSKINGLRRSIIEELKEKIISNNEQFNTNVLDYTISFDGNKNRSINKYTLINEKEIVSVVKPILSPIVYCESSINKIISNYQLDGAELILQLPNIADHNDLVVIEKLLSKFKQIKTLLIENIYGLYFISKGYKIIIGEGLNIANSYAVKELSDLGVLEFSLTKEYFAKDKINNVLVEKVAIIDNEIPLMTFANCFVQTIFGGDCGKCKYKDDIVIKRENHKYLLKRVVVSRCYFRLYNY